MSVGQGHGIIYVSGYPTYGEGPLERIGLPTTVPLLAGFLAACVVQVVGGGLLLWPRSSGVVVSVVGMLLGAIFWWGFDLPFAWLNAAVVLTFFVLAWMVQKARSRSKMTTSAAPTASTSTTPPPGTPRNSRRTAAQDH